MSQACPVRPRSGHRRPRFGAYRRHRTGSSSAWTVADSLLALRFAAAAARRRGAPLEVVHVWQETDHAAHGRLGPVGESAKAQADREWQSILRSTLAVAPDVEIISKHVTGYALGAAQSLRRSCAAGGGVAGTRRLGGTHAGIGLLALHHLGRVPGSGDPSSCDRAEPARCGRGDGARRLQRAVARSPAGSSSEDGGADSHASTVSSCPATDAAAGMRRPWAGGRG